MIYGSNKTNIFFISILANIEESHKIYTDFKDNISYNKFNPNITHVKYYKSLSDTNIINIQKLVINIKTLFEEFKNINNKEANITKLNNLINLNINNTNDLKNLFDNKYYDKGLCSLQNIITYYFNKIVDGLECSLPTFEIYSNSGKVIIHPK